ncbi:hypothetical protein K227x_53140 [Rubripirellula lacrimiformis]|uniref:Uncharacterized protein n=1 Tax=Rubripirellula lacrimiformis TaxID=1930273 RepID=A0A517NID0_9BACT|nr:hypothetical protein [Rubripirellula lacrimiformis]QDT06891.1 hypothetical protein K227x_53140 [Rubripirellula lacrimiformis]
MRTPKTIAVDADEILRRRDSMAEFLAEEMAVDRMIRGKQQRAQLRERLSVSMTPRETDAAMRVRTRCMDLLLFAVAYNSRVWVEGGRVAIAGTNSAKYLRALEPLNQRFKGQSRSLAAYYFDKVFPEVKQ